MLRSKTVMRMLAWLWLAMTLTVQAQQPPKTVQELASALLAIASDAGRDALLEANPQLVTKQLCDELIARLKPPIPRNKQAEALLASNVLLRLSERLGYDKGKIEALKHLGSHHRERGERQTTLKIWQQALALAEAAGESPLVIAMHYNLCAVWQELDNLDEAMQHCQASLTKAEVSGTKSNLAFANNALGGIAVRRGENEKAVAYFLKSSAQFNEVGNKLNELFSLQNLGLSYYALGNFTAALQAYSRSLPLAEALDNQANLAKGLARISSIHASLGNTKLALETAQRSLVLYEKLGLKAEIGKTFATISHTHAVAADYEQALEYGLKGLKLAQETNDETATRNSLISVATAYLYLKKLPESEDYFQRALVLSEQQQQHDSITNCFLNLSKVYLKQGKDAESLKYADLAIRHSRQTGNQGYLWMSLQHSASALVALKQEGQARTRFEEALAVLEALRENLAAGENVRADFLAHRIEPYQNLTSLLMSQGKTAEAFQLAERAKARVLLDAMSAGQADISKAMTNDERRQQRRLRDELTNANSRLSRAAQAAKPNPQQLADLKVALEKARLDYESFQTRLYAAHPELRAQRGEAPIIKSEELAAMVGDKTALLEFVVVGQATYLFVITRSTFNGSKAAPEIRAYTLPIKQEELTKQANEFRQQLANLDLGFRASAKRLYELLLKPAAAQLSGKTQLVIVPDAALWELPFQALIAGDRYLIENAAVSYAPSLTALREMQAQRKQRGTGLLAFGNPAFNTETVERASIAKRDEKLTPLPEAETEVKALAQLHGSTSRVFIGTEASEARLKSEAASAGILHFATHGILNDAAPLYSHLALAAGDKAEDGQKEDGLLEAWELLQMNLNADLAVLSACETARGKIGAGEGVIGLSWAMFVAGIPTTVVSQWKVESSSTRDLMVGFHRNLKGVGSKTGATKAESLRQSALSLLKKPATNHPFYWAGFVLIGDGQ